MVGSRLANKVALITGSGSGIGRATAILFASEGAKVVVNDRVEPSGQETVKMITDKGGGALFALGDVSIAKGVKSVVDQAIARYGRIDILFNNAGGRLGVKAALADTSEEKWDAVIRNNLKSTFLMCKYTLPSMIKGGGGVIINMGSQFGLTGVPLNAAYCTAKAAIIHLSRQMSLDYGKYNIRINSLAPGPILTPGHEKFLRSTPDFEKAIAERKAAVALGRLGRPEDVASAALFLASEESSFATGTALVIDGGYDARLCSD